ncbi:MAG: hypothetical protein Q4C70_14235 [Planctomycetia bacterium]|nr:hypothetical protein [Planctomycetia bacterium]
MSLPPLPMTVFEEYMLLDGTPAYPMECYCRLRFSGGFHHETFERVLAEILTRNPFLYAHARETKPSRYVWEIPEFGPNHYEKVSHTNPNFSRVMGVRVYWLTGTCRGDYPDEVREPLDIFHEGMVRYYLVEEKSADGTVLRTDWTIKCHHCASDGKGMFQFIGEFLTEYARQQGVTLPTGPALPPTQPEMLAKRHHYGRTRWERAKILLTCIRHLPRSLKLIGRGIQPIVDEPENDRQVTEKMDRPAMGFPKILFRLLDAQKTTDLLARCRKKHATFNDIMLQSVWDGTKSWRQKHPDHAYSGQNPWIRIAVPANLRHPRQTNLPICNVVSMLFCDRKETDIDTSARFLSGIIQEMAHVKKYSLGFLLIQSLKDARFVCGNLRKSVKMCSCWTTMVLTNIGPVLTPKILAFPRTETQKIQIGTLILDEIDSCSPIRPQTNVSICCITYANTMNLSLVYDNRLMSEEEADSYFTEVMNSMETILE